MARSQREIQKLLESNKIKKIETLEDAIKKVKSNCTTKFNESIDISLILNLKNKKDEAGLRTTINLPNGNGKKVKVAVICEDGKNEEAKKSGADFYEAEKLINGYGRILVKS